MYRNAVKADAPGCDATAAPPQGPWRVDSTQPREGEEL